VVLAPDDVQSRLDVGDHAATPRVEAVVALASREPPQTGVDDGGKAYAESFGAVDHREQERRISHRHRAVANKLSGEASRLLFSGIPRHLRT
jgi:hypothetical protein